MSRPWKSRLCRNPSTRTNEPQQNLSQNAIDNGIGATLKYLISIVQDTTMPRPKRTKVAPSSFAPRVRSSANPTAEIQGIPKAPEPVSNYLYDFSHEVEGAVNSVRHIKKPNWKGNGRPAAPGQLENVPFEEDRRRISESRRKDRVADGNTSSFRNGPETAAIRPGPGPELEDSGEVSSSPEVEIGRRAMSTPAAESSILAIGNFRRRARQPSILGRATGRGRSSSVDLDLADENGPTNLGTRNNSAQVIGSVKGRPRQHSIIARDAAPMRSSSAGLEMDRGTPAHIGSVLRVGSFRRRAREPSILRTAQKGKQHQVEDEEEDEVEDDFNPEDESTPLNLSKTRGMTNSSVASTSNSRKRKLSSAQLPRSSQTLPALGDVRAQESAQADRVLPDELDEGNDETSSDLDRATASVRVGSATPELLSETMALPQSSSSVPSSPEIPLQRPPTRGRQLFRARTPPLATQDSPISSPPSLTFSPNRRSAASVKPGAKRQPAPSATISTAQLQALLPRRRRRQAQDPYEMTSSEDEADGSGLASDDDELTHLTVRGATRRSSRPLSRMQAPPRRVLKPKPGPKSKSKPAESAAKRMYRSRGPLTSDKENEEDLDPNDSLGPIKDDDNVGLENSQELEERLGKELKRAARKFKEVDQWELEFEEVTASSSSPKDAR